MQELLCRKYPKSQQFAHQRHLIVARMFLQEYHLQQRRIPQDQVILTYSKPTLKGCLHSVHINLIVRLVRLSTTALNVFPFLHLGHLRA